MDVDRIISATLDISSSLKISSFELINSNHGVLVKNSKLKFRWIIDKVVLENFQNDFIFFLIEIYINNFDIIYLNLIFKFMI